MRTMDTIILLYTAVLQLYYSSSSSSSSTRITASLCMTLAGPRCCEHEHDEGGAVLSTAYVPMLWAHTSTSRIIQRACRIPGISLQCIQGAPNSLQSMNCSTWWPYGTCVTILIIVYHSAPKYNYFLSFKNCSNGPYISVQSGRGNLMIESDLIIV